MSMGPKLVNKQFNSPINLYSPQAVQETLEKQTKVLANGAVGIDFNQLAKPANLQNSAVLRMLEEEEARQRAGNPSSKEEADSFLQLTPTGRHGRVKIPKVKKYTPQNIHSPKKSKKKKMALDSEMIKAKALTKSNAASIAKAKKDVESRIKLMSSKTTEPSSILSSPPDHMATETKNTHRALPQVVQDIPCFIDCKTYFKNTSTSTSPAAPEAPARLHSHLRQAIFEVSNDTDEPEGSVTTALSHIFYKLQFSNDTVTTEHLTKNKLGETFDYSKEQDVHEFLQMLLNTIEREMKDTCVDDTVARLFEGKILSIVKCNHVKVTSAKIDTFRDVQLNVFTNKNLYEAFEDYIKGVVLDGDNKYRTDWHGLQVAEKKMIFQHFPPVLCLHLLRFVRNPRTCCFEKYNGKFEFSTECDLQPYLNDSNSSDAKYTLQSVLVHSGEKDRGHYIAFIDSQCNGKWHKFDDEKVTSCTKEEALDDNFGSDEMLNTTNAYMLVYVRTSEIKNVLKDVTREDIPKKVQMLSEPQNYREPCQSSNDPAQNDISLSGGLDSSTDIKETLWQKDAVTISSESEAGDKNIFSEKHLTDIVSTTNVERFTSLENVADAERNLMDDNRMSENKTEYETSVKSAEIAGTNVETDGNKIWTEEHTESDSSFLKKRPVKKYETSTSQCTTYSDLGVESVDKNRRQWKHKLPHKKNETNSRKKGKKEEYICSTSMKARLIKMENKILTAIRTANVKNSPIAFPSSTKESFELPIEANPDGKITVLGNIVIDHASYLKAADMANMKKRVNAIVEGLWTLEERSNLTVDTFRRSTYRRIKSEELNNVKKLCLHLQHHRELPLSVKGNGYLLTDMSKWISAKLRTDRYRNTEKYRTNESRRNLRRKTPGNEENRQSTDKSANGTSDSDIDAPVKKQKKHLRVRIFSDDSDN